MSLLGDERRAMIYIVIGQSGAGKTTFAKRKFMSGKIEIRKDIVPITVCDNGVTAIGKYGIGIRTEGTDTTQRNAKNSIKKQIKRLKDKDLLLEGDRITSREIFEFIASIGTQVKMYLVTCSVQTSIRRLRAAGSAISPAFVKYTKTKSKKLFLEYRKRFHGEIVDTELDGK